MHEDRSGLALYAAIAATVALLLAFAAFTMSICQRGDHHRSAPMMPYYGGHQYARPSMPPNTYPPIIPQESTPQSAPQAPTTQSPSIAPYGNDAVPQRTPQRTKPNGSPQSAPSIVQ